MLDSVFREAVFMSFGVGELGQNANGTKGQIFYADMQFSNLIL